MNDLIYSYLMQKPLFDEEPILEKKEPVLAKKSPNEMESLFGKLAPDLLIDPPIVFLWKKIEDLPFLQKVAQAVTQSIEAAECREFEERYFETAKVIVADAACLGIKPHQLEKNPIRLGIYRTTDYLKNVELKRDLWKLLQSIGDLLA